MNRRTKEVTDDIPQIPDVNSQIAEAFYEFDEYWRIVDVLHSRYPPPQKTYTHTNASVEFR